MKEPPRLMSGSGPARELMRGSALRVPPGARQRALEFTSAAVGLTASATAAAAGSASLAKSLLLTVSLSALGGGVASLAVSETFSRLESAPGSSTVAAPRRAPAREGEKPAPVAPPPAAALVLDVPEAPGAAPPTPPARAPTAPIKGRTAADTAMAPSSPLADLGDGQMRPSLLEQQSVIEAARAAVARGEAGRALETLDGYDRRYAHKQFAPEALALRVQALSARGQLTLARSLAKEFEQRYPHHPLLTRVQSSVAHF